MRRLADAIGTARLWPPKPSYRLTGGRYIGASHRHFRKRFPPDLEPYPWHWTYPRATTGRLRVAKNAGLACLLEATAPKPGNVHRGADFQGLTYLDFAAVRWPSGRPSLRRLLAAARRVSSVPRSIAATREAVGTNTNLRRRAAFGSAGDGAAAAMRSRPASTQCSADLNAEDAQLVYEAIRLANPGGMGKVEEADVHGPPPADLLHAMRLAAERDLIARQYTNGFADVFERSCRRSGGRCRTGWPLADTIVYAHLRLMSRHPDSLIARKCGAGPRRRRHNWPQRVLEAGRPATDAYHEAVSELDFLAAIRRASPKSRHDGRSGDGRFVRAAARGHNRTAAKVLCLVVFGSSLAKSRG